MPDVDLNPTPSPLSVPTFAEPTPPRVLPTSAVAIAATAVAILVAVLVLLARRHPATPSQIALPSAAYAPNLIFTGLQMSDATNGSGGHLIYIEGHVANHGLATVTGVTVQLTFANDVTMPPQIETVPLSLIYMREPYVDTHLVSAAPMAPRAEADFRLIFDDINDNWNQRLPHLNVVQVATR